MTLSTDASLHRVAFPVVTNVSAPLQMQAPRPWAAVWQFRALRVRTAPLPTLTTPRAFNLVPSRDDVKSVHRGWRRSRSLLDTRSINYLTSLGRISEYQLTYNSPVQRYYILSQPLRTHHHHPTFTFAACYITYSNRHLHSSYGTMTRLNTTLTTTRIVEPKLNHLSNFNR